MTSTVEMTPSIRSFLKDSRQYDQNERPSTAVVGSSRPGTNRRHQVYDTSTASNISEARRPVSTKRPGLYPSSNDTVGGDVSLASLYSMDQLYPRDDDFFQKSNRIVPKRGVDGDDEDLDAWSVKPGGLEDVDLDDDDDSSSAASF